MHIKKQHFFYPKTDIFKFNSDIQEILYNFGELLSKTQLPDCFLSKYKPSSMLLQFY